MKRIIYAFRQGFVAMLVLLMTCMAPTSVMAAADTASTDQNTNTTTSPTPAPTASSSTPSNGPTGADAGTYHYDTASGLWVNDHFTYDPSTQTTTPKVSYEYTYNAATGLWDTQVWQFNANTGIYDQVAVSVKTPPQGAITHGGPTTDSSSTSASSVATATPTPTPTTTPTPTPSSSPTTVDPQQPTGQSEGSGYDQHHDGDDNNTGTGGSSTGATIGATVDSTAASGDATASHNDTVGNTATGNTQASATVVNQLQSQSGLSNPNVATFTANIQGNVTGDMLIDPASFSGTVNTQNAQPSNITVNNANSGTINNTITLAAASGNATADSNNTAGNISSGNAAALADVINMINSVVAANQSFVGTINIYGDYTGNILMPQDSLNALLGTNSAGAPVASSANSNSSSVANNVNLAAASGDVNVTGNDNVGNVGSGNALTNITILNLTGHQIVAANSLLVFVNVMGSWYGLIMNAPAGSTAAALGGGVVSDTALPANTAVASTNAYGITNTINATANSGSATATNNRTVGNVTSGNALASADIANLLNNNLSLSGWFGILFINVFGTWHGNFGVVKPPVVAATISGSTVPGGMGGGPVGPVKAFAFIPTTSAQPTDTTSTHHHTFQMIPFTLGPTDMHPGNGSSFESEANSFNDATIHNTGAVLGTAPTANHPSQPGGNAAKQAVSQGISYWSIILFALGAAGFGLIGVERVRNINRSKVTVSGK